MAKKRKQPPLAGPLRSARTSSREISLRTVRPRPLHYEEKLRVMWPGDEELGRIDGGAFAKWLSESEAAQGRELNSVGSCQAQVVIVGGATQQSAPKKAAERPAAAVIPGTAAMLAERLGGRTIAVPKFRPLPRRDWPAEPATAGSPGARGPAAGEEAAYFRHRVHTPDELDQRVEYDLDSEDEEWLARRNSKSGAGQLTEADLERLIDGFEKARHNEIQQRQETFDPSGGRSPPAESQPAELYPASRAIEDFGAELPSLTVRAVHNHWAKKAAASQLPLLQRFWYDQPWAPRLARPPQESSSDSDDGVPFRGKDAAAPHASRGRQMDPEEAYARLEGARHDLERLRTIADRVRRRERQKKRELLEWRREWQERIYLARMPKSKKQKGKAVKATTSAPVKGKTKAAGPAKAAGTKASAAPLSSARQLPKIEPKSPPKENGRRPGTSLGGVSIISAVADQLRRLGSWGLRRADGRSQAPAAVAAELGVPPAELEHASAGSPAAPLTRKQEQEVMEAAIEFSLQDQARPGKPSAAEATKRVRFQSPQRVFGAHKGRATASGNAPVPHVSRSVSCVPGKRRRTTWTAVCKHGRHELVHPSQIAPFFREHSSCRPAWHAFGQRTGESSAEHVARLRRVFPCSVQGATQAAAQHTKRPGPTLSAGVSKRQRVTQGTAAAQAQMPNVKRQHKPVRTAAAKAKPPAATSRAPKVVAPGTMAHRVGNKAIQAGGSRGARAQKRATSAKELGRPVKAAAATQARVQAAESDMARNHEASEAAEPDAATAMATSSSGSDTCVPAGSDNDTDDAEGDLAKTAAGPRGAVRLTRQSGYAAADPHLSLPNVPLEWRGRQGLDNSSDASSFSEGSGPSLFDASGDGATGPRRHVRPVARRRPHVPTRKRGRIVVAARQCAKRAASRR